MGKMTYAQAKWYEEFKEEVKEEIFVAVSNSAFSTSTAEDEQIAEAVLRALLDGGWLDLPEYEEE